MRVPVEVAAEGRLALLTVREPGWTPEADVRAHLVAAAREAGFAHVALALDGPPPSAATDAAPSPAPGASQQSAPPGPPMASGARP